MLRGSVVSIGYERRTVAEMVSILRRLRVRRVIDVRELPLSRRRGFSKTALASELEAAGIEYRHVRPAGNPHRKLKVNLERCLALYEGYLRKNPEVVELVQNELLSRPVAILCYERVHDHCHRSVLLQALRRRERGLKVAKVE